MVSQGAIRECECIPNKTREKLMRFGNTDIPDPANLTEVPTETIAPELSDFLSAMVSMGCDENVVVDTLTDDPEALEIIHREIHL